ncbi:MAG: 1-acyl-sn-glycerol-3-phosphate acyltransferase [Proteobacteria bacterium]|nr:1-acyl-sn-glycerol-3-phosphate acyltransferase [Pseudomonadota bacterium]
MKISKLRTQWIMFLSAMQVVNTCGWSVFKGLTGKTNRPWVDMMIQRFADRVLKLVGVKCKIINPYQVEPKKGKPTIVMCNHSSLYDIPISFKAFPNHSIRMLAKKELSKIPIMSQGMTAAEFPFVDRKNRTQALNDLEAVKRLLKSGIVMWIAPEGTRSKNGKLAPFKKGAFITAIQTEAEIIPIGIRGAYDILPARTTQFNLNQTAEIHIGKAIDASAYSLETKDELIKLVHREMKKLVGEE